MYRIVCCFLARDSILCLARYTIVCAIARPPVRPSVLQIKRVDQSKTVKVRIIQFSPNGSVIPLVFAG